jgi:hypothetical protein
MREQFFGSICHHTKICKDRIYIARRVVSGLSYYFVMLR